jgi:hypothetical protein
MSPRTKSCAICRKKRIKCDATVPQCLMCERFGRECPGLDAGPTIIDMTNKARHGMQKRKRKLPPAPFISFDARAVPHQASINQISQQGLITEALYARFIGYFESQGKGQDQRSRLPWLHHLPQLSTDGSNEALALAVQATAAAYCAVDVGSPSLARHALDSYGRAIQIHSRLLAGSHSSPDIITVHTISTSVLFSFYEAIQATNVDAYRSHIYGAAKMFQVVAPTQYAYGLLCKVFFYIRTQMAFAQLTAHGEKTPVDVDKMLYGTMRYDELPVPQQMMTHFTRLAECYNDMKGGRVSMNVEECERIQSQVAELWCKYPISVSSGDKSLIWTSPITKAFQFRSSDAALVSAYYYGILILLGMLAPWHAQDTGIDHYEAILQAADFIADNFISCAHVGVTASLLLVAVHAPKFAQRQKAMAYFDNWNTGSMRGISALALECTNRRYIEIIQSKQNLLPMEVGKEGFVGSRG